MGLESDFVLFARVTVLWLQLAHLLEGEHCHFHLAEGHVRLTLPVEALDVGWVELGSLTGVKQSQLVFLELETRERPIAVENSFFLRCNLAKDGLSVLFGRILELLGYTDSKFTVRMWVT